MNLKFTKMHGCGNDFIMLNGFNQDLPENMGELAEKLCDRHFGIGADGVIALLPAEGFDYQMRLFQPDGSEAEMCGNGTRCAALFARSEGIATRDDLQMLTLAGTIKPYVLSADDAFATVRVDMGKPRLAAKEIPCLLGQDTVINQRVEISGREFTFSAVSMGNPHAVIFLDTDPESFPIGTYGPLLEKHEIFPAKANIEFAQVIDEHTIKMRVWERGVGQTLACGTGACATAVAAILTERATAPVTVKLAGGELKIDWQQGESVFMTGPAALSFCGELII